MSKPRIAICFFGITRSLKTTISGIESNILEPAQRLGDVTVFSHFFEQAEIYNPRSGEFGKMDPDAHNLLPNDWLELEAPDKCLDRWDFGELKSFGDYWEDDFRSLRNLVHQLHSLHRVTDAALSDNHDLVLFCRPDLHYFDSFESEIHAAQSSRRSCVRLPAWGSWHGLNDRFAIASGKKAINAYGSRIESALGFCRWRNAPLHAESLVQYRLRRKLVSTQFIDIKGARVRSNGVVVEEDFAAHPEHHTRFKIFKGDVKFLLQKAGLY